MLKQGDRVTLEYKSKTYSGVVVIETIVECPLSQDLRLASLSVVPPEPKRQLEPELDLKLDQNLERRALGRRQGRSTSEPPRQKHEPPPKPEQEHEPPPPRQDLKLPPGQDHNSPRQKHEPPRSAGIRASPRKRTCSRGQTTPPKKQKVLTGKKMISKRAGRILTTACAGPSTELESAAGFAGVTTMTCPPASRENVSGEDLQTDLKTTLNVIQCIQNLEGSVALLVRQQNTEQQC